MQTPISLVTAKATATPDRELTPVQPSVVAGYRKLGFLMPLAFSEVFSDGALAIGRDADATAALSDLVDGEDANALVEPGEDPDMEEDLATNEGVPEGEASDAEAEQSSTALPIYLVGGAFPSALVSNEIASLPATPQAVPRASETPIIGFKAERPWMVGRPGSETTSANPALGQGKKEESANWARETLFARADGPVDTTKTAPSPDSSAYANASYTKFLQAPSHLTNTSCRTQGVAQHGGDAKATLVAVDGLTAERSDEVLGAPKQAAIMLRHAEPRSIWESPASVRRDELKLENLRASDVQERSIAGFSGMAKIMHVSSVAQSAGFVTDFAEPSLASESGLKPFAETGSVAFQMNVDGFLCEVSGALQSSAASATIRADAIRVPFSQIADHIIRNPDKSVDIALSPKELGHVRMQLSTTDGSLTIVVTTERAETTELMRRNMDTLMQEFRRLGFDQAGFEFRQKEQGAHGRENEQKGSVRNLGCSETPELAPSRADMSPRTLPASGLDMRV